MRAERLSLNTTDPKLFQCPGCDGLNVVSEIVSHRFKYGADDQAVELRCLLPVRVCRDCGSRSVGEEGEMARHEAVCRHLGLLTPKEIRCIRDRYGSQAQFSKITGVGEASLSRWENGAQLQSKAFDNYLFLLSHPDSSFRLAARGASASPDTEDRQSRFRCIEITSVRREKQRIFKLRPTG